ncbi:MAG: uridine kinase [Victivallaceae bacterium]|nr:uridine kinase [Victivallaceae bacterium]
MRKLILIAGGSGSGKTWFCERLRNAIPRLEVLETDDYYFDCGGLSAAELAAYDFDLPSAIDFAGLRRDVKLLLSGRPVPRRVYDFAGHRAGVEGMREPDFEVLAVAGLFALTDETLRGLAALTVFVDAPDELRLSRRLERDLAERGRTVEDIRRQYCSQVRPMYEKYVAPSASFADMVVRNDGTSDPSAAVDAVRRVILQTEN